MEKSLLRTFTPEEIAQNVEGDVYMIKANMHNVEKMISMYLRVHEAKLHYNPRAVTKSIIFYQTLYDVRTEVIHGHWTGLALIGKEAYFFDSLGMFPDDELNRMNPNSLRISCTHSRRNIGNMLYGLSQQGYKINYNPVMFQEDKPQINTCGRYVIMFLNEAIMHTDPYRYMEDELLPYKRAGEKYWDNAIIRYYN
jgi:hypothetical protein